MAKHPLRWVDRARSLLSKLGPAWLLLLLWLTCPLVSGPTLVAKIGAVSDWLAAQPLHGVPQWTAIIAVSIGLGILPAYSNTVLVGWVYPPGLATVSAMTSYLLGACCNHAIARKVSQRRAAILIEENEQARQVQLALLRSSPSRALLVVSLFRLTGFPFPTGTLVLTSCGVRLYQNLIGTVFGLTPRVAISALILSRFAAGGAHDIQEFLRKNDSPRSLVLGLLFGLLIFGLIALIARRALRQLAAQSAAARS